MQYLLLIYDSEEVMQAMSPEQSGAMMAGYNTFTEAIKASGEFAAGEALEPVATAKSVRVRDGKTLATDGPFAETKEQLGGFYMVEAPDIDAAAAIAARIPSAKTGTVEVRPVMVWD